MPNIPGLTGVDQATFDRVFAAFNGDLPTYKAWLRAQLLMEVRRHESMAAGNQAVADLSGTLDAAT